MHLRHSFLAPCKMLLPASAGKSTLKRTQQENVTLERMSDFFARIEFNFLASQAHRGQIQKPPLPGVGNGFQLASLARPLSALQYTLCALGLPGSYRPDYSKAWSEHISSGRNPYEQRAFPYSTPPTPEVSHALIGPPETQQLESWVPRLAGQMKAALNPPSPAHEQQSLQKNPGVQALEPSLPAPVPLTTILGTTKWHTTFIPRRLSLRRLDLGPKEHSLPCSSIRNPILLTSNHLIIVSWIYTVVKVQSRHPSPGCLYSPVKVGHGRYAGFHFTGEKYNSHLESEPAEWVACLDLSSLAFTLRAS